MRRRRQQRNRRGVATLELILVVPILLIVLVFSIQFGIVAIYQATVTHSATVAAREAGKGADFDDTVLDAIQQILGVHGIDMELDVAQEPDDMRVVLDDGVGGPDEYGSLDCPLPTNSVEPGEVRVTVCVGLSATRFRDALKSWNVSFAGRMLKASSLVMKEYE